MGDVLKVNDPVLYKYCRNKGRVDPSCEWNVNLKHQDSDDGGHHGDPLIKRFYVSDNKYKLLDYQDKVERFHSFTCGNSSVHNVLNSIGAVSHGLFDCVTDHEPCSKNSYNQSYVFQSQELNPR